MPDVDRFWLNCHHRARKVNRPIIPSISRQFGLIQRFTHIEQPSAAGIAKRAAKGQPSRLKPI